MVKQVFLPKGRFTEAWSMPNADTQCTIGGGRGGQRADKTLKVYIFLAQKNTSFILQTKSASLPGILQPPNSLHKEPNFLCKTVKTERSLLGLQGQPGEVSRFPARF
ncbi:unnamed protein product [Rangifer tarandus platyrhynchus]|uniref:Uncharacterized protein n=2 Tax=Rangifer tarandus platyrhynchus TaxID=3082113 RepID=A0AC59ZSS4_RANTA|nr:unnamed protein product [Rangifer tarandus platyrhynchus]